MNMGIDEARQDELIAMILDRVAAEGRRQGREGPRPQDAAVVARDHGAFLMMSELARICPEAHSLTPNDQRHGATLSSILNRRIRQIWAMAMSNSASGEWRRRSSKLARI